MKLSAYLKKITTLFHHHRRFVRDPYRDWQIMLVTSIALCLIIVGIDGYMFYKLDRGELFSTLSSDSQRLATFDKIILQQQNNSYNALEEKFIEVRQATSTPIDPSL
jgi:undecaprenyl pyrophosphate phosphatase UppP